MDLDNAIAKHAEWKLRFRYAIAQRHTLDAIVISKDNCCELGKWLYGEGRKAHGSLLTHAACLLKHACFHVEAGKVAHAINAGKYDTASAMLTPGSNYTKASAAVSAAIIELQREVQVTTP